MQNKISILHLLLLSITVIGLKNHVTIIPTLIEVGGRDGWIAIIFAAIFTVPWLLVLVYIFRHTQHQPMRVWLMQTFGKVWGKVSIALIGLYCLLLSAVTMRETLEWIKTTFLATTPIAILLLIYTVLITLLLTTSLQTLAIVNLVVLFVVVVLGFFVAIVNIKVKDYTLLQPFLEHGFMPVVKASIYPASGFVELFPFLFVMHGVKGKIKMKHLVILLFMLAGLTLGPFLGAIAEFGPQEASRQIYPAYEEWGLATIGRFIEHMDFFSIYQWLTGTFIRVGFIMYVAIQLIGIEHNERAIWRFAAPALFFSSISMFFMRDEQFFAFKGHLFLSSTFFFFFVMSLIIAIAVWRQRRGVKQLE